MEDQALIKRAHELHEMGKSIRQIAGERKTSKSKVFRWQNGQTGNGGNALPIDLFTIATNTPQSINQKNKYDLENNNEFNKFEREIALKRLQLEHELELRKLVQQDRGLELGKRELELKHLEKDAISRQQQIEVRKINHGLKVWIQKERANLDEVDDEEIEMELATFKRHQKVLRKLWEQV